MNASSSQQRFIDRLHEADDDPALEALMRHRLGGRGPAVQDNESRSIVLEHSFCVGSPQYRERLRRALLNILERFSRPSAFRLVDSDNGRWRILVGALDLAVNIDWSECDLREDLSTFLQGWVRMLSKGYFPRPRDLWREERMLGYPETDLAAKILQLLPRNLAWDASMATSLWTYCLQDKLRRDSPKPQTRIRAARLWALANWALLGTGMAELAWLAKHIDELSRMLEAADWYPGDLTRLFLGAELNAGPERVAQLILKVPTPEEPCRRKELALQLDYFAEERLEVRRALIEMRNETSRSTQKPVELIYVAFTENQQQSDTEWVSEAHAHITGMTTGHVVNSSKVQTKLARFSYSVSNVRH